MNVKGKWLTVTKVSSRLVYTEDDEGVRRAFTKKELSPAYRKKFFPVFPTSKPTVSGTTTFDFVKATVTPVVPPPTLKTFKVVLEIDGCVGPKFADIGAKFPSKTMASNWVTSQLNSDRSYVNIGNVGFNKEDLICFSVYEPK